MYKQYEAFENAEEVWLWYCACLEARREGLRSRGDYQGPERPCEISDIERIVKYLRRQGKLRLRQLNTMFVGERCIVPLIMTAAPAALR